MGHQIFGGSPPALVCVRPIADIRVGRQRRQMRGLSIGFTAKSSTFAGATISIECTHYFEAEEVLETAWAMNVFAAEGGWVNHPGADIVEDDLESFISSLAPFYDGASLWTLDETDKQFTFWEMVVRTLPQNML